MTNPDPQDLLRLADAVEKATGPDRELDRAIKEAVGHSWDYAADWGPRGNDRPVAHAYTASLDAAMTLVPEGRWYWSVKHYPNAQCAADIGGIYIASAATPALALCAAALKARAHSTKDTSNVG